MGMVNVRRSSFEIRPDPERVLARPFLPGESTFAGGPTRVELIASRILALDDVEAEKLLVQTRTSFSSRHPDLHAVWMENARLAEEMVPGLSNVGGDRRELVGAFFTQEYAPEGAALCNPSIVPAGEDEAGGRFIMSLRAIGEGHISSVEFRSGSIDEGGVVTLDEAGPYLTLGDRRSAAYDKRVFRHKLEALGADVALVDNVMTRLPDPFTSSQLGAALEVLDRGDVSAAAVFETKKLTNWLASSNYELVYGNDVALPERILLPSSPAESRGIETQGLSDSSTTTEPLRTTPHIPPTTDSPSSPSSSKPATFSPSGLPLSMGPRPATRAWLSSHGVSMASMRRSGVMTRRTFTSSAATDSGCGSSPN